MGLNWRPDDDFCDFLTILRESKDIPEELHKVRDVPGTEKPKERPDISAEDHGLEDYSKDDLNKPNAKVKSKSQKDPKYAVRKVADKEVQNPVPLKDATQTVTEGIFELLGEVSGISLTDQAAVRAMVRSGKIPVDWPTEEVMINALSKLEDFVEPAKLGPDVDVKQAYLKHIIVPKALVWDKARECKEDLRQPLYLCNNCCKTFRANEAVCPECLSNIVEKVVNEVDTPKLDVGSRVELRRGPHTGRIGTVQEVGGKYALVKIDNTGQELYAEFYMLKVLESKQIKSKKGIVEKVYGVYCTLEGRTIGKQNKHFTVDAEDEKKAEEKVKARFPNAVITKIVSEARITETRYHVHCTVGELDKHLIIDAEDEKEAKEKVKRDFPDASFLRVVAMRHHGVADGGVGEAKLSKAKFVVYFTAEGQGKHLELPVENKEAAEAEVKRDFPDAVIHNIVEESKLGEDFEEEHGLGKCQDAEKGQDWDLTFKYPHDQLTGNPLLDKNGIPLAHERHSIQGKRVRVFSDHQARWVKREGAIPVREKPPEEPSKSEEKPVEKPEVTEQESEVKAKNYTVIGRGLDEVDATNIAQQKEGSSVVPDDQAEGKFMVMTIVKENKIRESVDEIIVAKTPTGDEVKVPADKYLNALAKGVGDAGYGYWFSGEERPEGKLVFEFISTEAPKIEIIVYGKIKKE